MELGSFVVALFVVCFIAACGALGKQPKQLPGAPPPPGEPEEPLIRQLLTALQAQTDSRHDRCPACGRHTLLQIERLCDMHLEEKAFICASCLKGQTKSDDVPRSCHRAMQDAVDATRKKYLVDLRQQQERLAKAREAMDDADASRFFPDHRFKLEANCREMEAEAARIQAWVDKLPADIVERMATQLADAWRERQRVQTPQLEGPYRSSPTP